MTLRIKGKDNISGSVSISILPYEGNDADSQTLTLSAGQTKDINPSGRVKLSYTGSLPFTVTNLGPTPPEPEGWPSSQTSLDYAVDFNNPETAYTDTDLTSEASVGNTVAGVKSEIGSIGLPKYAGTSDFVLQEDGDGKYVEIDGTTFQTIYGDVDNPESSVEVSSFVTALEFDYDMSGVDTSGFSTIIAAIPSVFTEDQTGTLAAGIRNLPDVYDPSGQIYEINNGVTAPVNIGSSYMETVRVVIVSDIPSGDVEDKIANETFNVGTNDPLIVSAPGLVVARNVIVPFKLRKVAFYANPSQATIDALVSYIEG